MLYLHIPFCKQACHYCNFHFSTSMKTRPAVLAGINQELRLRREELPPEPVNSVYFGGGTPSLLTERELAEIFTTLQTSGYLSSASVSGAGHAGAGERRTHGGNAPARTTEITLEANPDDLDAPTIQLLADSPVNRLSIGIQSFFADDLRFMNRAHTADQARAAVARVQQAGFSDVSIDLIYGGQTTTDARWAENLRIATDLGVTHISAYALTVEAGTALGNHVARGLVAPTDDARFDRHFNMLVEHLTAHGYRHYEISNFCLPGYPSQHNSGYWSGSAYLGVGPGAHSFDGQSIRRWNISNNAAYAKALATMHNPADYAAAEGFLYETETLSASDRYNEYIMTALRQDTGVHLDEVKARFGAEKAAYFRKSQRENVAAGLFANVVEGRYQLTRAGRMQADGVAAAAFWVTP